MNRSHNDAILLCSLEIEDIIDILNPYQSGEMTLLLAEFKHTLDD